MSLPYLSEEELRNLTALKQPAAQLRFVTAKLGLKNVRRRPNGTLLVPRAELERAMGAAPASRRKLEEPPQPRREPRRGPEFEPLLRRNPAPHLVRVT